ncbi:MAG: putative baseplate assembly protein [Betaproteobacteria bacterium]|nr:putative baseplate assembly protein [Betaproteobacteria bacterium]
MPLPLPNLDDRRFDDLVKEAQARLARNLPELAQTSPGDPVHALVDVFAWLTETILYRANQIPERQRRAFLNLLQLPLRPARPARGVVCIDAEAKAALPALVKAESALKGAGETTFSSEGEVQPTPLELRLLIKSPLADDLLAGLGVSKEQLREQYGVEPASFTPLSLTAGRDPIDLGAALDRRLYLALCCPKSLIAEADALRAVLAGITLNLGLAPLDEADGDPTHTSAPRRLLWELAWQPAGGDLKWLPLEWVSDSSDGARRAGVARLRLPRSADFLQAPAAADPRFAGYGEAPPEAPADLAQGQLLFWLRLSCPREADLKLGWLGVNAVEVTGQGIVQNQMLGRGTGRPDQVLALSHPDVDAASLSLQVEEGGEVGGVWIDWTPVEHFAASAAESRVYRLDAAAGLIQFGDGQCGKRPPARAGIRALVYRHGGGSATNLPAKGIKELHGGGSGLKLRHEWPTQGGVDAETVAQAEQRIPAFLTHRDRAVTRDDYALLARDNPINPVARADAVPGFLPGVSLATVRRKVPGVVSVFVLPGAAPALGAAPRPSAGLLRDVYDYLAARIPLGTELYVLSPQFQPISVAISLEATDPDQEQQVFAAVQAALLNYLWSLAPGGSAGKGWPLGRAVEINELATQAARVAGVEAVNQTRLFYQDLPSGAWLELSEAQSLPLADYQLPELMAMTLESGEGAPAGPSGYAPDSAANTGPAAAGTATAVPVPVIPDKC